MNMQKFENARLAGNIHFQNFIKAQIGSATWVYIVDSVEDDTIEFWQNIQTQAIRENLPIKILGGGTNLLISGDHFNGIIVKVDYPDADAEFSDKSIISLPGVSLDYLVNQAAEHGYDMSVLAGIPGTVGGAVYGNAGSSVWKRNIGEITRSIELFNLETGNLTTLNLEQDNSFFSWRSNRLKDNAKATTEWLIRRVELVPPRATTKEIKQKIQDRYKARQVSDEEGENTAGSFFASAILPPRLASVIKEKTLVRDLIANCPVIDQPDKKLPSLDINGATFTPRMAYLKTTATTTDHDIAKLLDIALRSLRATYDFIPYKEVDILGYCGSYTLEDFINSRINQHHR
jgi:UDP-N-acetylenolpyruvoylglucosamine reductase